MRKLKTAIIHAAVHAQVGARLALQKLKEKRGDSHIVAVLVMSILVVVVGGGLIILFNASAREWWTTLSGRISEMFDYK